MPDPRDRQYADLLLDWSLGVQPGWQVVLRGNPLARPLIEELLSGLARRQAYPLLQLTFDTTTWAAQAPIELLEEAAPLTQEIWRQADAFMTISAPENTREGSNLGPDRQSALQRSLRPLRERTMSMSVPWVICEYPVNATAQEAGMTLRDLEEFVYGAVLLDWEAEGRTMRRVADAFDAGSEVRIVAPGTDLTLRLDGRRGQVDDGHVNMPGGEVFYSPLEDSANGVVHFTEFPAVYLGHEVVDARLEFRDGLIVDATARAGEEFLVATLDTDEGARRLGEFGIGCNPGIQRFMKNVGFDEKIAGTVHLAVGNSYTSTGGTNTSAVHWDMVKDLRTGGGRIEVDGRVVQQDGAWRL